MGFVDVVGIAPNYVKQDFARSDTLANMLPITLFLWFAIHSGPTGLLMNKLERKSAVDQAGSMAVLLVTMGYLLFCADKIKKEV